MITVAYADPPYLGQSRHYLKSHPKARIWDNPETHRALIGKRVSEYPGGWAMSCSSPSLRVLLPLCPPDIRIGTWVKPFHIFKKGVRPAYAWEPVIYTGGRNANHSAPAKGGKATTPRDWVSANITLRTALTGAKPEAFRLWLFDLLNLRPGDEPFTLALTASCWWLSRGQNAGEQGSPATQTGAAQHPINQLEEDSASQITDHHDPDNPKDSKDRDRCGGRAGGPEVSEGGVTRRWTGRC